MPSTTRIISDQHDTLFNARTTRLFPNVIIKNDAGFQFITSANLLAILCTKLKEVVCDVISETEEPVQIILSGYSRQMLLCLDDFLHDGTVNMIGRSGKNCEAFCRELKYEFEEVLGIAVPQEFWELRENGYQVKKENVSDLDTDEDLSYSVIKAEFSHEDGSPPKDSQNVVQTEETDTPNSQNGDKPAGHTFRTKKQIVTSGNDTFELRPDGSGKFRINFPCPVCALVIKKRTDWFNHIKKNHPEEAEKYLKKPQCEGCNRTFSSIGYLERHQRSAESSCLIQKICDICGGTYKSRSALYHHIRVVHKEKTSECTGCGKVFKNEILCKRHFLREHQDKKVQCEKCEYQFTNNYELRQHIQTVHMSNDDKPFICQICGKGFGRKAAYNEHCRIHSAEKPFKCRFCLFACSNSSNIVKHEKLKHKDLYTPKGKGLSKPLQESQFNPREEVQ